MINWLNFQKKLFRTLTWINVLVTINFILSSVPSLHLLYYIYLFKILKKSWCRMIQCAERFISISITHHSANTGLCLFDPITHVVIDCAAHLKTTVNRLWYKWQVALVIAYHIRSDRCNSDQIMVTFSHVNEFETAMTSYLTSKCTKICTIKNTTVRNVCFS